MTTPTHLQAGECPTCQAPGIFDTESPEGSSLSPETNWIWYNKYCGGWECGECWLK